MLYLRCTSPAQCVSRQNRESHSNAFSYGGTTNVVIDVNGTFDVGEVPTGARSSALAPQTKMPNGTLVPVASLESLLAHRLN